MQPLVFRPSTSTRTRTSTEDVNDLPLRVAPDRLSQREAFSREQARQSIGDLAWTARALVDERGVDADEARARAEARVGVLDGAESATSSPSHACRRAVAPPSIRRPRP